MAIIPITTSIPAMPSAPTAHTAGIAQPDTTFTDVISDLLKDTNAQQLQADNAVEDLITGNASSVHEVALSVAKADLAFRLVLMALMLYGIFALPGVHPIPVALGISILVLAVVIEMFSEVLSARPPGV